MLHHHSQHSCLELWLSGRWCLLWQQPLNPVLDCLFGPSAFLHNLMSVFSSFRVQLNLNSALILRDALTWLPLTRTPSAWWFCTEAVSLHFLGLYEGFYIFASTLFVLFRQGWISANPFPPFFKNTAPDGRHAVLFTSICYLLRPPKTAGDLTLGKCTHTRTVVKIKTSVCSVYPGFRVRLSNHFHWQTFLWPCIVFPWPSLILNYWI